MSPRCLPDASHMPPKCLPEHRRENEERRERRERSEERAESREQRAESREQKAESREQTVEQRDVSLGCLVNEVRHEYFLKMFLSGFVDQQHNNRCLIAESMT